MFYICCVYFYVIYGCFSFENPAWISSLEPSALFYSTIHIIDHERVAYCISLYLTLIHLPLATKYIHFSVECE